MNLMQVQLFEPQTDYVLKVFPGTYDREKHILGLERNPPTNSASVGQSRRRTEVVGSPQFNDMSL